MTHIEKIRDMSVEEIAKIIIQDTTLDTYCKGDCEDNYDCPHPIDCCMN